jgi:hypothetical protein
VASHRREQAVLDGLPLLNPAQRWLFQTNAASHRREQAVLDGLPLTSRNPLAWPAAPKNH